MDERFWLKEKEIKVDINQNFGEKVFNKFEVYLKEINKNPNKIIIEDIYDIYFDAPDFRLFKKGCYFRIRQSNKKFFVTYRIESFEEGNIFQPFKVKEDELEIEKFNLIFKELLNDFPEFGPIKTYLQETSISSIQNYLKNHKLFQILSLKNERKTLYMATQKILGPERFKNKIKLDKVQYLKYCQEDMFDMLYQIETDSYSEEDFYLTVEILDQIILKIKKEFTDALSKRETKSKLAYGLRNIIINDIE